MSQRELLETPPPQGSEIPHATSHSNDEEKRWTGEKQTSGNRHLKR